MKQILLFSVFIFFFVSCEKIDDPIEDSSQRLILDGTQYFVDESYSIRDTSDLKKFLENNFWEENQSPDNINRRFITLEEFTGHKCQFCPLGTKEVIRLDTIHGNQLIPISIHAGNFARPDTKNDSMYTADFRVDGGHGEVYQEEFKVDGYPAGIVSRISGQVSSKDAWQNDINSIKNDQPSARLIIKNFFSDTLNTLRIKVTIEWLEDLPGNYNLQLFLTEDHIIGWQSDFFAPEYDVKNYDHRFMLRKVINGTFGLTLKSAAEGNIINYEYITSINPEWKSKDIKSIAFIFNRDQSSYEVMQANSAIIQK